MSKCPMTACICCGNELLMTIFFGWTSNHQPSKGKLPDRLVTKVLSHDHWPIHCDILTSRKPLWCVMTPTDIKSQWRESWKSAPVVNAHLVNNPTIWQPGFTLPRQQWSLLNHFRTGQGHCGACRKTWCLTDTDLCSCGET